ncbi:MAG: hypothetical protein WAR57_09600 [Candidatus Phosphoribacter sp.]
MTVRWKTLSTYTSQMRLHVIPALGAVRLSELRPETLEQHYRRLIDDGQKSASFNFSPTDETRGLEPIQVTASTNPAACAARCYGPTPPNVPGSR